MSRPQSQSADLGALAAIWVERWLTYGGGLVLVEKEGDEGLSISMRIYGRQDIWRSRHPTTYQRHWHDGWATGRWRELSELADLVPGLLEAIEDHVREQGSRDVYGRAYMAREHPSDRLEAA